MNLRKIVLLSSAAAITVALGGAFLLSLKDAHARELTAACKGLRPTATNKMLGELPTRAPDFTAQDHTGKMVKLSDYRGKMVVVRFWASWCETCKAEQPSLEELAGEADPSDLVVLSLASDPNWDLVRKKLPGGSAAEVLLDPPATEDGVIGKIAAAYGVEKVPESFVVDREGIIRYYIVNKRDWRNTATQTCLRSVLDGPT